jgi:hypothetical protein
MSNKENPSSGYLIEATKLSVFISEDQRPAFDNALADHDFEKAVDLLDQFVPTGVACPSQIFALSDTDTGDENMDEGTPYAFFDEEDLYEKQEKLDVIRLREKIGEAPMNHSWTIWG